MSMMPASQLKSNPTSVLRGETSVPGDKSISHRAVILASIADGMTEISGFLESEDCIATAQAFQAMGITIEKKSPQRVLIQGAGMHGLQPMVGPIHCGNSGTSMRLLAGLLAAQPFHSQLIGDSSLSLRPMERICSPLQKMGANVSTHLGTAPINITGGQTLKGICYPMHEASAQVKSGILLAGLYAKGETTIIESRPTRNHTELMLKTFSYPVEHSDSKITIKGKNLCRGTTLQIPGDLSSATFFVVAASLIPDAQLLITGVGVNPTRTGGLEILKRMGASIQLINRRIYGNEEVADLFIQHANLHGIDIPIELIPSAIDELPVVCIAAAHAKGKTLLRGAQELRVKESDRIDAIANGLRILGIQVNTFPDGLCIEGGCLQGGQVESKQDHRIAMAFAIAGLVATGPVYINDCTSIATSFPNFIEISHGLGLGIESVSCEV